MSLADYLAKNYLTADPKPAKKSNKRKRKGTADAAGLVIADDDTTGWETKNNSRDDEDGPTTVSQTRTADFRRAKSNNWKTVGALAPTSADQAAADAIIASAQAERSARDVQDDEAPAMDDDAVQMMESGAHAGLQTAEQVTAAMEKKRRDERRKFDEAMRESGGGSLGQETVYRDASGRRIDIQLKRAEARKKQEEEERKAREAEQAIQGDVQRQEREARKQQLDDAKYMTVARHADDVELNEEMKEQERWNDPAMQFLTKKKAGKSKSGKPLYKGGFEPNRYNIRPGYRWDGVDRGNGFEKRWFEARNKKETMKDLQYQWEMDE